jgi:phosphoribosylglycinamide formyltransferase-1
MKKIAVFASGKGSNFSAIMRQIERGRLACSCALLVCDTPGAPVLEKAERAGVPVFLLTRESCASREEFERRILRELRAKKVDLVVLAGFMRIIGATLINAFRDRIINIHPALLPAFKGAHAIQDAFEYGAKLTGVTVHFVDEKTDHGPIILQAPLPVKESENVGELEERIHRLEHRLYPLAIRLFVEGRLKVTGRKVRIAPK